MFESRGRSWLFDWGLFILLSFIMIVVNLYTNMFYGVQFFWFFYHVIGMLVLVGVNYRHHSHMMMK